MASGKGKVSLEYTVDLTTRIGVPAADEDLGDRFLTALEKRVVAAAVSQNTADGADFTEIHVAEAERDEAATLA